MSSLPSSLAVNVKRFQSATTTSVRITGDRSTYGSAGVMNFKLPQSGTILLNTASLSADMNYDSQTGAVTTNPYNASWIRRLEVVIGGQVVGLNQLNDYGFVHNLLKNYIQPKTKSDYQQSISQEGNLVIPTATAGVQPWLVSDFMGGLLGSPNDVLLLPLSLLPPVEINVMLHTSDRWAQLTAGGAYLQTITLTNVRFQYQRLDFTDGLLEQMWNNRLSSSVIQIPFMNISYSESAAVTASSGTFTTFANCQSLEYVMVGHRPGSYDTTPADMLVSHCGDTNATPATTNKALISISLNGTPLFNYQSSPIDSIWNTQASLGNSVLYSPDFGILSQTYENYKLKAFLLAHRVGMPLHENDGMGWCSGLSTGGQSIPIDVTSVAQNAVSKKTFVITIFKSTLELGAGRQIAVAL